jgi:hypothetical protein
MAADNGEKITVDFHRFLVVAGIAVLLSAGCLVLGSATDNTAISVAGILFVLVALGAREAWLWEGAGRLWLLMVACLVAVVLVSFAASKLFG